MKQKKDLFTNNTNRSKNLVSLDLSLCQRYSIDIDDLYVLYAQHINFIEMLNFILSRSKYEASILKLKSMGLSDGIYCLKPEMFGNFTDQFNELWNKYPNETPNGRKLKGNKDATKKDYEKFLSKNPNMHDLVIGALKEELNVRNRTGSTEYLVTISKWVKTRGWEYYIEESKENSQPIPGTQTLI